MKKRKLLYEVAVIALLLIPTLFGIVGVIGSTYLWIVEYPKIISGIEVTKHELWAIKGQMEADIVVPLDLGNSRTAFKQMGQDLRNTATTSSSVCVTKILGQCIYADLSSLTRPLQNVAGDIEGLANSIPSDIRVRNPIKDQAGRIDQVTNGLDTVKTAILYALIYKFIEHVSWTIVGTYLIAQRIKKLSFSRKHSHGG